MDTLCILCGLSGEEVKKLFCFPRNRDRVRAWNESLGIALETTYSSRSRICCNHFSEECFVEKKLPLSLKHDALPFKIVMENPSERNVKEELSESKLENVNDMDNTAASTAVDTRTNCSEKLPPVGRSTLINKTNSLRRILKNKCKQIRRLRKDNKNKKTLLEDIFKKPENFTQIFKGKCAKLQMSLNIFLQLVTGQHF